eukprot:gene5997-8258_t
MPQLKLEIFGGDSFLDDISDDDSVPHLPPASQLELIDNAPISRIPVGHSLLKDPFELAANLLQSVDILELARQWTLTDYNLFLAIPLYPFLSRESPSTSAPRYLQVKHMQIRRFIDRFNACSNWVAYSILKPTTAIDRAAILSTFIRLAGFLHELRNYNGLMAVLTALQQACIVRLEKTFSRLNQSERDKLHSLQKLMAGNKNYQNYRNEVSRMVPKSGGDWLSEVKISFENNNKLTQAGRDPFSLPHVGPDQPYEAFVPHIGAHLSELSTIMDGNEDHVSESPHLINLHKSGGNGSGSATSQHSKLSKLYFPYKAIMKMIRSVSRSGNYFNNNNNNNGSNHNSEEEENNDNNNNDYDYDNNDYDNNDYDNNNEGNDNKSDHTYDNSL